MRENTRITNIADIQIGESTHTHDHAITPVNFRAMKRIVRRPTNPIPPELALLLDELLLLVLYTFILNFLLNMSGAPGENRTPDKTVMSGRPKPLGYRHKLIRDFSQRLKDCKDNKHKKDARQDHALNHVCICRHFNLSNLF